MKNIVTEEGFINEVSDQMNKYMKNRNLSKIATISVFLSQPKNNPSHQFLDFVLLGEELQELAVTYFLLGKKYKRKIPQ